MPDLDDKEKFSNIMMAYSILGIGQLLGTFSVGYIADHFGLKAASIFNIVLMLACIIVTSWFMI